jgi:hypothetical protein
MDAAFEGPGYTRAGQRRRQCPNEFDIVDFDTIDTQRFA